MKYEKCPVCEEKLRNGICPMCGYDFNRLSQSRTLKDGHWDILTTDQKTNQPVYTHDEKRHPAFKNTTSDKQVQKKVTYKDKSNGKKKSKKGKWAILIIVIYLLQFLVDVVPDLFYNIEDFISQILTGLNL